METTKNDIKKIIWTLIVLSFASTLGYMTISMILAIVQAVITLNFQATPSEDLYNLSLGIYRIIEGILFCLIFRKQTFTELKEEKLNMTKMIPFLILIMYYSTTYSVGAGVATDVTAARLFRCILVAPIFEELMFRGAIQRTLQNYGGQKFAIIFTTLLFACYHMDYGQFFFTIPLGLLTGYAAAKYSIKSAILIHLVCNLMHIVYSINPSIASTIMAITLVGSFFVLIWKAKKIFLFFKEKTEKGTYKKVLFTCPMIIFLIIWILCMIGTT